MRLQVLRSRCHVHPSSTAVDGQRRHAHQQPAAYAVGIQHNAAQGFADHHLTQRGGRSAPQHAAKGASRRADWRVKKDVGLHKNDEGRLSGDIKERPSGPWLLVVTDHDAGDDTPGTLTGRLTGCGRRKEQEQEQEQEQEIIETGNRFTRNL